jgi:hypothetical protein
VQVNAVQPPSQGRVRTYKTAASLMPAIACYRREVFPEIMPGLAHEYATGCAEVSKGVHTCEFRSQALVESAAMPRSRAWPPPEVPLSKALPPAESHDTDEDEPGAEHPRQPQPKVHYARILR